MNFESRTASSRKLAKRGYVALALLALSLVLARPICDAYAANAGSEQAGHVATGDLSGGGHSDHDERGPCCASIDDGAIIGLASGVAPAARTPAMAPPSTVAGSTWPSTVRSHIAAEPPDRPPLVRSYHARTARILI